MPITNADIAALPTYTDAELLKLARNAITAILVSGQAYDINGRSLTRTDLPKLWATVEILEGRINNSDGTGGIALAAFS